MSAISQFHQSHSDHECTTCGGPYSPEQVWGSKERRVALLSCDWCETKNFAAVSVMEDASPGEIPEELQKTISARREQYPERFTVLTVAAHIEPGFPDENFRIYNEQTGSIRVSNPSGDLDQRSEFELCSRLRSPSVTVGVDEDGIVVSQQAGGYVSSGDGTPEPGRVEAESFTEQAETTSTAVAEL